jgi:hypothetical protein
MRAYYSLDAGAVVASIDCAFSAQDAGRPFVVTVTIGGVDGADESAYVRTPDGRSFQLHLVSMNCQQGTLDQWSCTSFVPDVVPPSVTLIDAGLPGIACDGQGAPVCACVARGCG